MARGSNPKNVQAPTQATSQMPQGGPQIGAPNPAMMGQMPMGGMFPSMNQFSMPGGMAAQGGMPAPMPGAPEQPNVFQQSATGLTNAMSGARDVMNYNPTNVSAARVGTTFGYTPQNVSAQAAFGGINQYMNPYTQNVIDTSMADLERQRMMQQNQLGAQAGAAGAFGGSRQGIAEAETNRAFAQQGGQLAAQLRQQGFQTALGASQQDIANQIQAALANQGAFARSQEFGQATGLQAQTANQQAAIQAALANENARANAANLRLSGAGQLSNLANTGFNMGRATAQDQATQGLLAQQTNQALINALRGQYGGFTGAPTGALNTQLAGVTGANMGQQTTTETQRPGLLNFLSAGLGLV